METSQGRVFYDETRKCWVGTHPKWGDHVVVLAPTKEQAEKDLAFVLAAYAIGAFRS